jgi:hypothetical protein
MLSKHFAHLFRFKVSALPLVLHVWQLFSLWHHSRWSHIGVKAVLSFCYFICWHSVRLQEIFSIKTLISKRQDLWVGLADWSISPILMRYEYESPNQLIIAPAMQTDDNDVIICFVFCFQCNFRIFKVYIFCLHLLVMFIYCWRQSQRKKRMIQEL